MILTNKTSLGVAHFTAIDVPPLEFVRMAARAGYAAVGLRLHPAFPGAPYYALPTGSKALREIQLCLEGEGISVYDIEFVVIGPDFSVKALEPALESAAELGAERLSVCGDDRDWSRLTANVTALCQLAERFAIGVDLECMPWRTMSSVPLAAHLASTSGRSNCNVLVDALHLSRSGGSPETVRAVSPDLIQSAQLCDAPAQPPRTHDEIILEARSRRLPPGMGRLPLQELISALPDHTVLSVEVPKPSNVGVEEHLRLVFDSTQALFERWRDGSDLVVRSGAR